MGRSYCGYFEVPGVLEMNPTSKSFVSLSINAFKLLPKNEYRRTLKILLFAIILTFLDIFSLSVILPLLQLLLNEGNFQTSSSIMKFITPLYSLNWKVLIALIASLFVMKNSFSLWHSYIQSQFLDELYIRFAKQSYHSFYQQSWIEYTKTNSSETFRKIKNTPYEFTHTIVSGYLTLIPEILIFTSMTFIAIVIDFRILLIVLFLMAPLLIYYIYFKTTVISKLDKSFRDLTPKASIALSQGIDGFTESKIYKKENYFIQKFITISRITTSHLSKLKVFMNLPNKLTETLGVLSFIILIIFFKTSSNSNREILMTVAMLSLVLYKIVPSSNKILTNVSQIQAYAHVIYELLETKNHNLKSHTLSTEPIVFNKKIEIKSVSFRYNNSSKFPVLNNVSCNIQKGDFIILEGPSGVGKTTFLNILAGLITSYEGMLLIDDISLTQENIQSWQDKLGFVPQSPIILQDTILKNIGFGLDERDISISKANEALVNTGLFQLVNSYPLKLDTQIGENGITLSGGQRQRLILARVLYRNPELLLLDEVTNQLDEVSKLKILTTLKQLSKSGKTIILATHDPIVKEFATEIILLKDRLHGVSDNVVESSLS